MQHQVPLPHSVAVGVWSDRMELQVWTVDTQLRVSSRGCRRGRHTACKCCFWRRGTSIPMQLGSTLGMGMVLLVWRVAVAASLGAHATPLDPEQQL
jgi:hypothetical protein